MRGFVVLAVAGRPPGRRPAGPGQPLPERTHGRRPGRGRDRAPGGQASRPVLSQPGRASRSGAIPGARPRSSRRPPPRKTAAAGRSDPLPAAPHPGGVPPGPGAAAAGRDRGAAALAHRPGHHSRRPRHRRALGPAEGRQGPQTQGCEAAGPAAGRRGLLVDARRDARRLPGARAPAPAPAPEERCRQSAAPRPGAAGGAGRRPRPAGGRAGRAPAHRPQPGIPALPGAHPRLPAPRSVRRARSSATSSPAACRRRSCGRRWISSAPATSSSSRARRWPRSAAANGSKRRTGSGPRSTITRGLFRPLEATG